MNFDFRRPAESRYAFNLPVRIASSTICRRYTALPFLRLTWPRISQTSLTLRNGRSAVGSFTFPGPKKTQKPMPKRLHRDRLNTGFLSDQRKTARQPGETTITRFNSISKITKKLQSQNWEFLGSKWRVHKNVSWPTKAPASATFRTQSDRNGSREMDEFAEDYENRGNPADDVTT
jgi:hypothetical protein